MKQKIEQKAEDILEEWFETEFERYTRFNLKEVIEMIGKDYPDLAGRIEDVVYEYAEELVVDDMRDIEIDKEIDKDDSTN